MPFKIQRVPRGLNNLLSIFGGGTPQDLQEQVQGTLELLQMYGLQQRQTVSAQNGALAEAGSVTVTLPNWSLLFWMSCAVQKTATMTALRVALAANRGTTAPAFYSEEMGPFGATETGLANASFYLPYPLICPPGTILAAGIDILGTDATANTFVVAEIGVLG